MARKRRSVQQFFNSGLFGDKIFLGITIVGVLLICYFFISIASQNNLKPCFSPSCVNTFFSLFDTHFKPILFSTQLFIAILVLYTIDFRSRQTAEQIEQASQAIKRAESSDSVKHYLDHRKSFFELLSDCESEDLKFDNKSRIYSNTFPRNSMVNFNASVEPNFVYGRSIHELIEEYLSVIRVFRTLGSMEKSQDGDVAINDWAQAFVNLNVLLLKFGVSLDSFRRVDNGCEGAMGEYPYVPVNPEKTINSFFHCLNAIVEFSVPPKLRGDNVPKPPRILVSMNHKADILASPF